MKKQMMKMLSCLALAAMLLGAMGHLSMVKAADGWSSSTSATVLKPDGVPVLTFDSVPEKGQQFVLGADIVDFTTSQSRGFHVRTSGGHTGMLDANYYPFSHSVGGNEDDFIAEAVQNPKGVNLSALVPGRAGNESAFTDYAISIGQQTVTGKNNANRLQIDGGDIYMIVYCSHIFVTNDFEVLSGEAPVQINGAYQDDPSVQTYSKYHWWESSDRYDYSRFTSAPSEGTWSYWGGREVTFIGNKPFRNVAGTWRWEALENQLSAGQAKKALITVLDVNETAQEALVLIVLPASNATGQSGATLMRLDWKIDKAELSLTKSSADTAITAGNPCYSLEGIQYAVYTDAACTTLAKDTAGNDAIITLKADGTADAISLLAGSYWVRELYVPAGSGYQLDTVTVKPVTLKGGDKSSVSFSDRPLNDPAGLVITKVDAQGNTLPSDNLAGAQYTLKYYAGQFTRETLPATPDASWVIETKNVNGFFLAELSDEYCVEGDKGKYGRDSQGRYNIPLGTLTIEETKAPAGFAITGSTLQLAGGDGSDAKDGMILVNIVDQNSMVFVRSGNQAAPADEGFEILQKETSIPARASLKKVDSNGNPVAGAVFSLKFTDVNGQEKTVEKTSGSDGRISWSGIRYGSQAVLTEVSAPAGYAVDPKAAQGLSFTITGSLNTAGTLYEYGLGSIANDIITIPVSVKKTSDDGVMEGFSFLLSGTDIFGQKVTKTAVTDKTGTADFGTLPYGDYTVKEELSPDQAMYLNEGPWRFTLNESSPNPYVISAHNYRAEIGTRALDQASGTSLILAQETVTITDTVSFKNLKVGQEYTVSGILMDKATGKALLVGGQEVTASVSFTPETKDGEVELSFVFNGLLAQGKTIVVFESLLKEGREVAVHAEIEDEDQTVYIPAIATTASFKNGEKLSQAQEETILTDRVSYSGLKVGQEYTVSGTLMDKATGKALLIDGKEVSASAAFTPDQSEGEVELSFVFNGLLAQGKTIVVFESLLQEGREVAVHAEIEDEDQTVYIPAIATTASFKNGAKSIKPAEKVTVIDRVSYSGLMPGQEYTVSGILMDLSTGKALLIDGKEVSATLSFTPEKAEGFVELSYSFDASALKGKTLVVFEKLKKGDTVIAAHEELQDKNQQVTFTVPDAPNMGDDMNLVLPAACLTLAGIGAALIIAKTKKEEESHD